jgi:hypothetical protein
MTKEELEKEAEEYLHKDGTETEQMLNNITLSLTSRQAFVLKNAFKQTFKDGAEFGYNKANEWHYNEVPKNDNDILCQISKDEVVVGYYHTVAKRYITIDGQDLYNVIAWKEIVLPELKGE